MKYIVQQFQLYMGEQGGNRTRDVILAIRAPIQCAHVIKKTNLRKLESSAFVFSMEFLIMKEIPISSLKSSTN